MKQQFTVELKKITIYRVVNAEFKAIIESADGGIYKGNGASVIVAFLDALHTLECDI